MKESKIEPSKATELYRLYEQSNMPTEDMLISLGLFLRASALTKLLFLDELYREIKDIPGAIMEFGCWCGQNLVVFENLRAIYEPFNQRAIVGFDTFSGHAKLGAEDIPHHTLLTGSYQLPAKYPAYLRGLLAWHQSNNVLKGYQPHQVVAGDIRETLGEYVKSHPEMIVALAYFDMGLYEPTISALEGIKNHLIKGSVIMLDEFADFNYPGETKAFVESFYLRAYSIKQSKYMPNRTIVKIK